MAAYPQAFPLSFIRFRFQTNARAEKRELVPAFPRAREEQTLIHVPVIDMIRTLSPEKEEKKEYLVEIVLVVQY